MQLYMLHYIASTHFIGHTFSPLQSVSTEMALFNYHKPFPNGAIIGISAAFTVVMLVIITMITLVCSIFYQRYYNHSFLFVTE